MWLMTCNHHHVLIDAQVLGQRQATHASLLHSSPTLALRHILNSNGISDALSGKVGLKSINAIFSNNIKKIHVNTVWYETHVVNEIVSGRNFLDR